MNWLTNKFFEWPDKPAIITKYFQNNEVPLEYWDDNYMNKYITDAINDLIDFVYKNNKYYMNKLEKCGITKGERITLEKFSQINCLTKEELQSNPYLVLSVSKKKISQIHLSTGTTSGQPIYMMYTWDDLFVRELAPEMPILFPLKETDIVVNALPYEMSSAGLSYHRVMQNGSQSAVIPAGKGGVYSAPKKILKMMKELKANVMLTSPSYAIYLSNEASKLGIDLKKDINICTIWITGEGCSDAFRKRIEEIWGCKAYFYYGSLECGAIGIECAEQNGYHMANGHNYIEIIDPDTGKVLDPGQIGEIVVTTLLREGCPLIRYRTKDLGYIEDIECECGIKLKRLFLRGRKSDQINILGNEYSPYYIEENLMSIKEVGNNYKFIVYDDYILIKTEVKEEFKNQDNLEDMISSRVEFGCGIPNKVEIVDSMPYDGKKVVRVINKQSK